MKNNNRGFTLAELLVVVAIIAVLVAIAIPIFTNQLEKAREATDAANIRDYYAEIATALVTGDLSAETGKTTLKLSGGVEATYTTGTGSYTVTVTANKVYQTVTNWQIGDFEVAGVKITSTQDMKGKPAITYTFTEPTQGNAYLSKIEFGTGA